MTGHPDVVVGQVTDYAGTELRVVVCGTEVVVSIAEAGATAGFALAPDEAAVLIELLERALTTE